MKNRAEIAGIPINRIKNKFFIAGLFFIIWVIFADQNSLLERYQNLKILKQLERDKAYYEDKIQKDVLWLNELKTNNENLEKFAREQYLMKRPNEDVYIIVDK